MNQADYAIIHNTLQKINKLEKEAVEHTTTIA
jgi:hypothetical protein